MSKHERALRSGIDLADIGLGLITPIAKKAGIRADQSLVDRIIDIAARYRDDLQSEPSAWRDARITLNHLLRHLRATTVSLSELTPYAVSSVTSEYRAMVVTGDHRKLHHDIAALNRMASIVSNVLPNVSAHKGGGAPPKWARDQLFSNLADLWGESSGRRFRYPDKRQPIRGSEFVRGLVKLIDPRIKDNECDVALEALARSRRRVNSRSGRRKTSGRRR